MLGSGPSGWQAERVARSDGQASPCLVPGVDGGFRLFVAVILMPQRGEGAGSQKAAKEVLAMLRRDR
jgi:hypothetical protein